MDPPLYVQDRLSYGSACWVAPTVKDRFVAHDTAEYHDMSSLTDGYSIRIPSGPSRRAALVDRRRALLMVAVASDACSSRSACSASNRRGRPIIPTDRRRAVSTVPLPR